MSAATLIKKVCEKCLIDSTQLFWGCILNKLKYPLFTQHMVVLQ